MDNQNDTISDEQLAILVQSGQEEPFGILVNRYSSKLLRYGRKFISDSSNVEDVVQEVFIKVYINIKSFDTTKKFSPWIYRIAHNSFVNFLRKNSKEPLLSFNFDALLNHPIYDDPIVAEKENREIRVLIDEGLDKLTPVYREVIVLHYFEDLSYQEIADVLHIPVGTVGIRLRRAREVLKKHIKHD